jgi:hypothetical protein
MENGSKTYTREEILRAVNAGAEMAIEGQDDLLNLAVNAIMTLLDKPDASIQDVITECYGEDADEVLSWVGGE